MAKFVLVLISAVYLLCPYIRVNCYNRVVKKFEDLKIVPDLIKNAPNEKVVVNYTTSQKLVNLGNTLKPSDVRNIPVVVLSKKKHYYTLAMVDPDAPSHENPTERSFNHWLVGNIFEGDVANGEILAEYIGSQPPVNSGVHRYTFLVYKQDCKLEFNEPRLTIAHFEERKLFSVQDFVNKYKLGDPVAGNFFLAEHQN